MSQTVDLRTRRAGGSPASTEDSGRIPPHNLQAEESLLGAMLLSRDAIAAAAETCVPADFYKPAHGHVYEAILSLWQRGEPADPVTVADELTRADLLEAIGGPAILISLQANTPATTNAPRYARIVEEHALLRRLIRVAGDIAETGYSVPEDVTAAVDHAEALMFDVAQRRVADTMAPIRELLSQSLDRLEALYERGEAITGVPTGFTDLDERLSGLQPSSLVIVGARPSMGKCVAWDTPVVDPTSGELRTAADVHRRGEAGEIVDVLALDDDRLLRTVQPSAYVDDGIKPVFSVRTRLGRRVRTTLSHPFLTPQGWMPLGRLRVGSSVAVPRRLPVFGIESLPENELSLLGFLLPGGEKVHEILTFKSHDTDAVDEVARKAQVTGARALRKYHSDGSVSVVLVGQPGCPNPVGEMLRRHGVLTSSPKDSGIPSAVYRLPKVQLAYFLKRLLAIGGSIVHDVDGPGEVRWATESPCLAQGVQHLLLRFGLNVQIRWPAEDGVTHTLVLSDPAEIRRFAREIGMVGHDSELKVLVAAVSSMAKPELATASVGAVMSGGGAESVAVFAPTLWESAAAFLAQGPPDDTTELPSNADILWDEIVSLEYDGEEQVYDLTVPFHHNFVAGDFVVHNTSFALNLVSHAALANVPVLLFSLEMSHLEITQRLLCSEARVDASRLRNGRLHDSDWPKINHAIGRLGEAPIYIDDNPNCTVMDIRAKSRRLKSTPTGLGLVVVDYVQLMSGRSKAENRQVEVSEMSRGLKILARELDCPVLALSQLSRGLEQRADKRPVLADLRESGSLEQDADVVMFLYRDEVYNTESPDKGTAEVIVSKHRNGPVGTTQLAFIDRYTRFANMARV